MRRLAATGWATALAAALAGCGTAPANLKDSDFNIREVALPTSARQAGAAFREGMRVCRRGGALGIPDCGQEGADGALTCNMFVDKGFGMGRSSMVLGIVDVKPAPGASGGSIATLKVQTWVGRNHIVLDGWEKRVRGQHRDECPGR